jgi:hypothetical protein
MTLEIQVLAWDKFKFLGAKTKWPKQNNQTWLRSQVMPEGGEP